MARKPKAGKKNEDDEESGKGPSKKGAGRFLKKDEEHGENVETETQVKKPSVVGRLIMTLLPLLLTVVLTGAFTVRAISVSKGGVFQAPDSTRVTLEQLPELEFDEVFEEPEDERRPIQLEGVTEVPPPPEEPEPPEDGETETEPDGDTSSEAGLEDAVASGTANSGGAVPEPEAGGAVSEIETQSGSSGVHFSESMSISEIISLLESMSPQVLGLPGESMDEYEVYSTDYMAYVDGAICSQVVVYRKDNEGGMTEYEGRYLIERQSPYRLYRIDSRTGSVTQLSY